MLIVLSRREFASHEENANVLDANSDSDFFSEKNNDGNLFFLCITRDFFNVFENSIL